MRLFAADRVLNLMNSLGLDEDTPIDAKILSGAVENAQKSVESRNFRARKNVLEYDDVMNTQREVIYAQRKKVLDGEDLRSNILSMLRETIDSACAEAFGQGEGAAEAVAKFDGIYFPKGTYEIPENADAKSLSESLYNFALAQYEKKEAAYGAPIMRELERVVMLRVVDEYWMDNIDAMEDLKQGIGLRAYGQHDPVIAYKEEGYEMFQAMITAIREETVRRMFLVRLNPTSEVKREKVAKETGASGSPESAAKPQPIRKAHKVGPNDPCPCGSGKKYKKCCRDKDIAAGIER